MQELKETGRAWTWSQREQLFKEFTDFVGLPEVYEAKKRYDVK